MNYSFFGTALALNFNIFFSLTAGNWIDIVVIAILIYIALRLLFETRSLSVAIGIVALAILYGLSTAFNLALTHLLLKSLFGFLVIIIAIIFQQELRRLFSFVGFFSFQRSAPPAETTIATVSSAVAKLSKRKIGALIVFPGKESASRYFEGGISLGGSISPELLLSIFSEETPGHDGAVIIEGNEARRFGVHLPLAEHPEIAGKFGGLRHRAALGLSERSDAFIIVVSGETGSIDIARHGTWEHCADEQAVYQKLFVFSNAISPRSGNRAYILDWTRRNVVLFAISFGIAGVTWAIFAPDFAMTQRNFTVPLEFQNVPAGYVVQDVVPRQVVLTLQGQATDFESLNPQSLDVSLDLKSISGAGWKTVTIGPGDVDKPTNFSLVQVRPESMEVNIVKNDSGK
jgi:diadenylate cyclase